MRENNVSLIKIAYMIVVFNYLKRGITEEAINSFSMSQMARPEPQAILRRMWFNLGNRKNILTV